METAHNLTKVDPKDAIEAAFIYLLGFLEGVSASRDVQAYLIFLHSKAKESLK